MLENDRNLLFSFFLPNKCDEFDLKMLELNVYYLNLI